MVLSTVRVLSNVSIPYSTKSREIGRFDLINANVGHGEDVQWSGGEYHFIFRHARVGGHPVSFIAVLEVNNFRFLDSRFRENDANRKPVAKSFVFQCPGRLAPCRLQAA